MKFRLMQKDASGNKTGPHNIGPVVNGRFAKTVRPGEIVESDSPLDERFRNKFERVSDATPTPDAEPQSKAKRRGRK